MVTYIMKAPDYNIISLIYKGNYKRKHAFIKYYVHTKLTLLNIKSNTAGD